MKIGTKHAVAAAIGITLFLGAGLLPAQQTKALHKAVALPGVFFSKVPQNVQMARPAELANIPPAPAALAPQARMAAFNQTRTAAGLSQSPPAAIAPARVVLTPEAPKSGRSHYAIYQGSNYPDPYLSMGFPTPFTYVAGYLLFTFETIPGKTYMVDLYVSPHKDYGVAGLFSGIVRPQDGHILVGFTANAALSVLQVDRQFTFYRCELTLVN
jgi:hypothetical protein